MITVLVKLINCSKKNVFLSFDKLATIFIYLCLKYLYIYLFI